MEWGQLVAAGVFAVITLACVAVIAAGLPGMWLMLGLAVSLELLDTALLGGEGRVTFGWTTLGVAGGLTVVAELLEAAAGAAGSQLGGGTRRGMWGALFGGLLGAIVFTPLIPIPIVGTLLGAMLGTFAGALYGELTVPEIRTDAQPVRAALGAVLGRLVGTLGKLMLAVVVWTLLVWAAFSG